eukprot:UN15923
MSSPNFFPPLVLIFFQFHLILFFQFLFQIADLIFRLPSSSFFRFSAILNCAHAMINFHFI